MARVSKKTGKTRRKSGVMMISAVVLVLCFIFAYNSVGMKARIQENAEVEADLRSQIAEQEQLKEDLVRESEYIQSDAYIEEIARDKLGLVHDNEIIFKKENSK